MDFEVIDNANAGSTGGAGIQSGQLVSEKGVKAVLTGNVGPNAFQTLNAANIDIITGVSGSVNDVLSKYQKGELKPTAAPTVDSHFGMPGGK
jgi:predicted Fe-Mo cluster-binding NifX family protein